MNATVARAAAAVAAVTLLAAVGCSGDDPEDLPDLPSLAPTEAESTLSPTEQGAADEVLTLVDAFHELEVATYGAPSVDRARNEFPAYVAEPILTSYITGADLLDIRGQVRSGRPTWDPLITEFALEATPAQVTVRDCLDARDWPVVDAETGEPFEPPMEIFGIDGSSLRPVRQVIVFAVQRLDEGWRLTDAVVDQEAQC